ncbi:unnamed protein product, partial [Closterium sp. NIES-65]
VDPPCLCAPVPCPSVCVHPLIRLRAPNSLCVRASPCVCAAGGGVWSTSCATCATDWPTHATVSAFTLTCAMPCLLTRPPRANPPCPHAATTHLPSLTAHPSHARSSPLPAPSRIIPAALCVAEACAQGAREEGSSAVAVLRGQLAGALRAAAEREREQEEAMQRVDGELARLQGQADAAAHREELAAALIDRLHADNEALRGAPARRPGGRAWQHGGGQGARGAGMQQIAGSKGGGWSCCSRCTGVKGSRGAEMQAGSREWGEGGAHGGAFEGRAWPSAVGGEEPEGPPEQWHQSGGSEQRAADAGSACGVEERRGGEYESAFTLPVPRQGAWSRAKQAVAQYYGGSAGEEGEQEQREREVEEVLEENGRLEELVRALQAQVGKAQRVVAWQGRLRQRVLQLRVCLELTSKVVDVKDRALELAVHRARAAENRCTHLDRRLHLLLPAASSAAPAALVGSSQAARGADGCGDIAGTGLQRRCAVAEIEAVGGDAAEVQHGGEAGAASRHEEGGAQEEGSPEGAEEGAGAAVVEAGGEQRVVATVSTGSSGGPACAAGAGAGAGGACKAAVRRVERKRSGRRWG